MNEPVNEPVNEARMPAGWPGEAGHVSLRPRLDGGAPPGAHLVAGFLRPRRSSPPRARDAGPRDSPGTNRLPAPRAENTPERSLDGVLDRALDGALADRDDDTVSVALVPLPREELVTGPETSPRGLGEFDLGTVPASVTPPRTWRKAAWFAVGTSAAVVCGLAVAAVRLVGAPTPEHTIDALPAYPTNQLEIENLPAHGTSASPHSRRPGTTSSGTPTSAQYPRRTDDAPVPGAPAESVAPGATPDSDGDTGDTGDTGTGDGSSAVTPSVWAAPPSPTRTTVGAAPVMPTDPKRMGDRTERYFALVTEDPRAAYELCTGVMAHEGPEGLAARYEGVERVEVQEITINRNQAITTSTVKVIHDDSTETIEERQLSFTWGDDPRISHERTTG